MWGQGLLKGQEMKWEIPVKKGENFKAVIVYTKSSLSMQKNWTGSLNVLFSSCMLHTLVKKRIWKFYIWTIPKLLDDMKVIFKPIDLIFFFVFFRLFRFRFRFFNVNFWKFHRVLFSTSDFLKNVDVKNSKFWNFEIAFLQNWTFCVFWYLTI